MTKVLMAVDESPSSLRAARAAVRLFGGAEFFIVNVAKVATPWVPMGAYGAVEGLAEGWEDMVVGIDEAELERISHWVGVDDPHILTETGSPAARICEAADEHDVDVVVIGGHDKGFLQRLLSPSVIDGVVHGTSRPVLVVSDVRSQT